MCHIEILKNIYGSDENLKTIQIHEVRSNGYQIVSEYPLINDNRYI